MAAFLIELKYAYFNSIPLVIKNLRDKDITKNGKGIEKQDVLDVLKAKPVDDLHRIIQSWYRHKARGNKVKSYSKPRKNGKQAMLFTLKSNQE